MEAAFSIRDTTMLSKVISHAKILIVDDELANVRLLEMILEREGCKNVSMTTDPRHVTALFNDNEPDLVLLDLNMPHMSGYEVMEALHALRSPESMVPIVVLTADATPEARRRALTSGATDFICKPFDNLEVIQRIKNVLQTRYLYLELLYQNQILEERVKERTTMLEQTLAELHAAQQKLMQEERLHALGKMAAGIAHDFNNILSLVLAYGEMLLEENVVTENAAPAKCVRNIISASRDGVEMVKRLALFQRPVVGDDLFQTIDLAALINQGVELTRPRWQGETPAQRPEIVVERNFSPEARIVGDPNEIRDLLINAIFNAVDAMPDGGRIIFRTRAEGDWIVLEIGDTGVGMDDETRAHCLEPFFTTKGPRGSGLGLAMISGIARRHHGTLEVETAVGVGTKLLIRLPNESSYPMEKNIFPAEPVDPLPILVVDDEPLLCEVLSSYLSKDGHRVTSANDGTEALQKFQQDHFDVVITDATMPQMNGKQLAGAIRKLRAETKVILLSGHADAGVAPSETAEIDFVVGKPVSQETLRQAIAKAVGASGKTATARAQTPGAGFIRTRPEDALTLSALAAQFAGSHVAALLKTQTQN